MLVIASPAANRAAIRTALASTHAIPVSSLTWCFKFAVPVLLFGSGILHSFHRLFFIVAHTLIFISVIVIAGKKTKKLCREEKMCE
jgi:glucan phosphoethanolaminetransferase (alkaline phosphatase superfamily)